MSEQGVLCRKDYESISSCILYFYKIFNDIRYNLKEYEDYKFNVKINDPILRYIAIYLIANYDEANIYFSEDGKWQNNYACESLNKWLDNKKSYFTHALHCKGNVQLWDKTIEPLWKELEKKSKENNVNPKKWCTRKNYFTGHLELPKELKPPTCYKHVPKGYSCVFPFPPNMCYLKNRCYELKSYYAKCKNKIDGKGIRDFSSMFAKAIANGYSPFKSIDDVTFSRQVQNHCACPSVEYATPISFTPLGSVLSYRGINKKRLRDNFNEEIEYEEYARSINKNPHRGRRINNIYYDSMRN